MAQRSSCSTTLTGLAARQPAIYLEAALMPARCRRRALLASALGGGLLGWAPWASAANDAATTRSASLLATSFYSNFKGMTLLDQDGRRMTPARLVGRTVLVNFVFTGCSTVCPVQTRALVELQQKLPTEMRRQFHILSVSIDPLGDTPAALKSFASRMGVDTRGWTLVTGKPDEVERLAEKLILFRPEPDTKRPADHSTALWLIDAQGELRMRYNGNSPDIPRLLKEIPTVHHQARLGTASVSSR
jgi:protein SCO1